MAETVTTIQQAPDYLKPGIEKFLEGATAQAGQAMDTSKFAPSVVGLGALQQQAQQQAATQAGLGTLQFDPNTGAVSGVQGTGVAGFQPFLSGAETSLGGVQPFIDAAGKQFQAQAGFTQANQLAAQAFGQAGQLGAAQGQLAGLQSGLANQQLGFATTQPQLAAGAIGMSQGLGQSDLAYRQAVQDAQQGANRMAAFEPVDRLARFGQGLTGVGGMLGSVQTQTGPAAPTPSPLSGALQAGIGAFSLGKLFG